MNMPFQTFDEQSDASQCGPRLSALRAELAARRLDGFLVPRADEHQGEYVPKRPEPPRARAVPHPIELAGETSAAKRARLAEDLKKRGADAAILTMPDSVCWLLNIRGADVPHTPFVLAFAILNADASVELFMDAKKSSPELLAHLGNEVHVRAPADFEPALDALKSKTAAADPVWPAAPIFQRLEQALAKILRAADPCQLPKACKNEAELAGTRRAHIRDGQALTRFLAWFAREAPNGTLTEIDTV